MKAFKINPNTQTITEVDQNGLDDLRQLIGCRTVAAVGLNYPDVVYVDDEGLYADPLPAAFEFPGLTAPLTGIGIVTGTDDEGSDTEPACTRESLESSIKWLGPQNDDPQMMVFSWDYTK